MSEIVNRKTLVVRANRLGVGMDVGWRFEGGFTLWPMNVKDADALRSLVDDLRQRGQVFDVSSDAEVALGEIAP